MCCNGRYNYDSSPRLRGHIAWYMKTVTPPPLVALRGPPAGSEVHQLAPRPTSWLLGPPAGSEAHQLAPRPTSWLRGPPAGSEALPAGFEAHPALLQTLLTSPEAHHAASVAHFLCGNGHHPLRGRCPLTIKLTLNSTLIKLVRQRDFATVF